MSQSERIFMHLFQICRKCGGIFTVCAHFASQAAHVFNYVDKPDFTMNELTDIICDTLNKKKNHLRLPYSLGLLAGSCFDLLAKITGENIPSAVFELRNSVLEPNLNQMRSNNMILTPLYL